MYYCHFVSITSTWLQVLYGSGEKLFFLPKGFFIIFLEVIQQEESKTMEMNYSIAVISSEGPSLGCTHILAMEGFFLQE